MNPAPKKPSIRSRLASLGQCLALFRTHRDDPPVQMLVVFLLIGQRNGVSSPDLIKLAGISQSSVSRNVQALGQGKEGEPGLGLVAQSIDYRNPKARIVKLTAKGRALAEQFAECLGGLEKALEAVEGTAASYVDANAKARSQEAHWSIWVD